MRGKGETRPLAVKQAVMGPSPSLPQPKPTVPDLEIKNVGPRLVADVKQILCAGHIHTHVGLKKKALLQYENAFTRKGSIAWSRSKTRTSSMGPGSRSMIACCLELQSH